MPVFSESPIKPLGLGEVALRVADLERSISFYCDLLGFSLIRVLHDSIAFVRIADGVEGHTQVIGLFSNESHASPGDQRSDGPSARSADLHHFAIEISLDAYHDVLRYLTEKDLKPDTMVHDWIGWRSIYVLDPDQNTVEFVSYDPSVPRPERINNS
jgi:catechol 2,3-dioxygenase